jgi:hypothetical protein
MTSRLEEDPRALVHAVRHAWSGLGIALALG